MPNLPLESIVATQGGGPTGTQAPRVPPPPPQPNGAPPPVAEPHRVGKHGSLIPIDDLGPQGAPAPVKPAEPEKPALPKGWEKILTPEGLARVPFKGKTAELTPEEIVRRVNIGTSYEDLQRERAAFDAEKQVHAQQAQIGRLFADFQRKYPDKAEMVEDIILDRAPARAPHANGADDPLTDEPQAPMVNRAYDRRIAQLEATVQQAVGALQQREHKAELERALAARPFLRSNPKAVELAKGLIPAALASGEYRTYEDAALGIEGQLKELAQSYLEGEREAREAKRETATPAASFGRAAPMPTIDWSKRPPTTKTMREDRGLLVDLIQRMRSAVSGP